MYYSPFFSTAPAFPFPRMTSHHHSLITRKPRIWHLSRSSLIPFNEQWKGEVSDHLTGARRNNLHQGNFKETQMPSKHDKNKIIWNLNHVPALISIASHRVTWHQGTIHLRTPRNAEISASNNSCYQPVLVVVGYTGVGARNRGQNGHTESEAYRCRRSEPTQPQKFCKGFGLLSPSHTI